MMCINCAREPIWVFQTPGVSPRNYCDLHLPTAYRGTPAVSPAPKDEPVEVEPEAEPVVEAPQVQPKRARSRRKVEAVAE